MARRRSGLHPAHIAGAVAFLALVGGGFAFFNRKKSDEFEGAKFSAAQYQQSYIGMRGNLYVVTGTVTRQLRYAPDSTRLFSLSVTDDGMSQPLDVGVLVPARFSSLNIQTGQEFQMQVKIDQNGLLVAENLRKS